MADINGNVLRFQYAGELYIGTDRVLHFNGASLELQPGGHNKVQVMNNGTLGEVLEGDQQPSTVVAQFFLGYESTTLTTTLANALQQAAAGTDGLARKFTVDVRARKGPGQTKWARWTNANCVVKPGFPRISGNGDGPSTVTVEFHVPDFKLELTDYTPGA
jgi:hypothetical protein